MALPRRVDSLVLSGTRCFVRPAAGVAHGGEQAALTGRDDLEAAVPPVHLGARLACRDGGWCAERRLDLVERRRFR